MRDRLIELLNKQSCPSPLLCDSNCKYAHLQTCYAERVADYLLANGVIVPPCKVGDTVYAIKSYVGNPIAIITDKVQMIGITSRSIHIKLRNYKDFGKTFIFGKTVFLTKEEAEQALKGGAE